MFAFAGKQAVDGAIERLRELILGLNPLKITNFMDDFSKKIPIFGDIRAGYTSMSDEEKAEFMRNIMIASAKLAAKI